MVIVYSVVGKGLLIIDRLYSTQKRTWILYTILNATEMSVELRKKTKQKKHDT